MLSPDPLFTQLYSSATMAYAWKALVKGAAPGLGIIIGIVVHEYFTGHKPVSRELC
jgi:hypothetical protein